MTPDELRHLLPVPLQDLLELPDPPTEMDLDTVLPILLERAESMAGALSRALANVAADLAPQAYAPAAELLHELLHAATEVFRAWNRRPGQGGIPPLPPAPEPPDVTLPDPDTA